MAKLRLTHEEKEMCGLTPSAVEMPSEDELGAKNALPRKGFIPIEEISAEGVPIGLLSASQLQECLDPLEFLARNMRLV